MPIWQNMDYKYNKYKLRNHQPQFLFAFSDWLIRHDVYRLLLIIKQSTLYERYILKYVGKENIKYISLDNLYTYIYSIDGLHLTM